MFVAAITWCNRIKHVIYFHYLLYANGPTGLKPVIMIPSFTP